MADKNKKTTEEEIDQVEESATEESEEEEAQTEETEEEVSEAEESEASDEDEDADDEEEEASEEAADEDEEEDADDEEEDEDEAEASDEDDSDEDEELFNVSETSEVDEDEEEDESDEDEVEASDEDEDEIAEGIDGLAAYFDYPQELLDAAAHVRDSDFEKWDAFSPFPIHGIEDAMGIGRSWLPWVTFGAGGTGFILANLLQFGTLTFDWPMIIGGKPHAPWPSFVPIMFELTVLIGGVTSALVMFIASGCFRKPKIIDPEITNDRFLIWIDANDPKFDHAHEFLKGLDPVEIKQVTFDS